MNTSIKYFAFGTIGALIILAAFFTLRGEEPQMTACTEEAKICPDGSAVGRTGPQCEFAPCPTATSEKPGLLKVTSPAIDAVVASPLEVSGEARGYWYFEASFPVAIYDAYGTELGIVPAQAQGEWMTEEFVPFKATLTFKKPTTETGYVVFKKDNPSGLPENDDELRIPVRFTPEVSATAKPKANDVATPEMRTVTIYLYDESKDKDEQGNIKCSEAGLVPVTRTTPYTRTLFADTINLLLESKLTGAEKSQGFISQFPTAGLTLLGISQKDGVLTMGFEDSQSGTSGGSCRVSIMRAQVEATAKKFSGSATTVEFTPDTLFQP